MSITSQAKRRPAAIVGRGGWKCPCGSVNPAETPSCLSAAVGCSELNPALLATERAIVNALEPTKALSQCWAELRRDGASDWTVCNTLDAAFAANSAGWAADDPFTAVWDAQSYQLWLCERGEWKPGDPQPNRKPDLAGNKLVQELRRLYGIPTGPRLAVNAVQEPAAGSAKADGDLPVKEPAAVDVHQTGKETPAAEADSVYPSGKANSRPLLPGVQVNAHGVVIRGHHTETLPFSKGLKLDAGLHWCEIHSGEWSSAAYLEFDWGNDFQRTASPLSLDSESYTSEWDCLESAFESLRRQIARREQDVNATNLPKVHKALAELQTLRDKALRRLNGQITKEPGKSRRKPKAETFPNPDPRGAQASGVVDRDGGTDLVEGDRGRPRRKPQKPAAPAAAATSRSGSWAETELALLGTKSDAELAAQFGRTTKAVAIKRQKLKIPAFAAVESGERRVESQKPKPQRTESERIADYKRPIADRSTTRKETPVAKKKPAPKPAKKAPPKKPEQKATETTKVKETSDERFHRCVVCEDTGNFFNQGGPDDAVPVRIVQISDSETGVVAFAFEYTAARDALGTPLWDRLEFGPNEFRAMLHAVEKIPF